MRNIFFLIILLLSLQPVFSQVPPSPKTVEAQKQQAILEAKQMVADLRKQIAEAIANKEDPDNIQEMEKQLAIMQQTIIMLEKTSLSHTRPTTLAASKTVLPKYVSPIVPVFLKQPVVAPSKSQAKDTLLWYTGKKLNDSTLVTIQNTVVQYSRRRNLVVVQADKNEDTLCLDIANSLGKCSQWTNDYVNNVANVKNSFFDYPQTMNTMDELKFIDDTYRDIVKNTIDAPVPVAPVTFSPGPGPTRKTGASRLLQITIDQPDNFLNILHQNLVDYMNAAPSLDVREPNTFYNSCTHCGRFKERHAEIKKWQSEFLKYEKGLLDKMGAIKIWMMKEGITAASAGIPGLNADLNNALYLAFDRWDRKVATLEQKNSVDFLGNKMFYTHIVIENLLYLQVQRKLYYGIVDNSYTTRINNLLTKNQQGIIDYYQRDMGWWRFNDVFDTWIVAGFDRHYKILKGSGEPLRGLAEKIKAFNRFSLTITINLEIELKFDDNIKLLEADAKLTTKDKVYVSMGRLGDCRWQFYLTNTDYTKMDENAFRIPMIVEQGTKYSYFYNPLQVIMKPYTGPKDLLMVFPYTSFTVCNTSDVDTIIVDILRYEKEDLSQYRPSENEYSIDLQQYVNKMFISGEKTQMKSADVVSKAYEMMNAAFTHGKVDKPTGYPKLDQMQVDFKMKGIQQYHQEMLTRITNFPNTLIRASVFQDSPTICDTHHGRSNTELEGRYNLKTAQMTIKVVHDPL